MHVFPVSATRLYYKLTLESDPDLARAHVAQVDHSKGAGVSECRAQHDAAPGAVVCD